MLDEVEMAQTLCVLFVSLGFQVFSVVGILSFGTQFVRWRKELAPGGGNVREALQF